MKFYMHQRIIGENLIKIGLILSAQWRFSEERYQACPVTLILHLKPSGALKIWHLGRQILHGKDVITVSNWGFADFFRHVFCISDFNLLLSVRGSFHHFSMSGCER